MRLVVSLVALAAVAACNSADLKSSTTKGSSDQSGDDDCFEDCRDLPNVAPTDSGDEADAPDAADG